MVVAASGGEVAPDAVGLAVNSGGGRSQDQLHLHLDCVQPSVRIALRDGLPARGADWWPVPTPIEDARYLARRIPAQDVTQLNPFAAVAGIADWRAYLRDVTFAATALPGSEGGDWVLLAQRASGSSAEHLLDPSCRIADGWAAVERRTKGDDSWLRASGMSRPSRNPMDDTDLRGSTSP